MSNTPELYALLVGIDRYDPRSRVPNLRGCVNDVEAMATLLQRKFGMPAANLRKLLNEAATHQAIKLAFRHHLIKQAKAWADAGRQGAPPAFVFHYSGHGSQARDETGTEPDGMDETLVAHDSRVPGIYDIKDWELGQLITELNQYSDNVTIILDCCHSGSGTRNPNDPTIASVRRCPPDLRPQPPHSQRPPSQGTQRSLSSSNWEVGGQHVLLAGCRDKEESNEYGLVAGTQRTWRGAMTYFLQRELEELPSSSTLTYRELHERIRYQVNSAYPNQMPQCEGDRDRELFGGLRPQRDAFFTVLDKRDGYFWIDGGIAHGLNAGTLLDVYPKEARTLTAAGTALARLQVEEEGATQSGCTVVSGDASVVEIHARCVVYQISYRNLQRAVALAIPEPALAAAVRQRLGAQTDPNDTDVSSYLQVVEGTGDFRVALQADQLAIQDNSGQLLVAPIDKNNLEELATDLAHLARYRNALELRNTAPHTELAGAIQLTMKELAFDATTQQPIAKELARTAGGELINVVDTCVVFEVTNRSNQNLYFALLGFSPDWGIYQIYPAVGGAHEALKAGNSLAIGLSNRRNEQIQVELPKGMVEGRDLFKVIATVQDTSFEMLEQGPLKSPFDRSRVVPSADRPASALDEILQSAMHGQQARAYGPPPATVADEWTTTELEVTTVATTQQLTKSLRGGTRTALPAFALEVEPPAGFTGQVRILTAKQSTRAADDTLDLQMPPGLAPYPNRFAPVTVAATRAAAPAGVFLELEADDEARKLVTPATPLKLHLTTPLDEPTPLFAVAFDGSFYYPVGRSSGAQQTIQVEWLPESDPDEVAPLRSTRGVGRVLKLYLYKLVGHQDTSLGLHQVRFVPRSDSSQQQPAPDETVREVAEGLLYYRAVDRATVKPKARVAVGIHGFSAESREQAVWLCRMPAQHGRPYDYVLTFDYESFNTGISENGQKLANALRSAGLDQIPGLQLDLFAHSMGTMIARCMVELWGGDAFVSRCFLAGPPNSGTRLAEIKKLIPWMTTLAVNGITTWAPAVISAWVLEKVEADATGVEDLRPHSQILTDLNSSTKPVAVPYFILAGHNSKPLHLDVTSWQRLKYKVMRGVDVAMDSLFGEQNDLVIGLQSMLGVRNGHYPVHLLQSKEVDCTHFEYFTDPAAQAQLLTWVQAGQ